MSHAAPAFRGNLRGGRGGIRGGRGGRGGAVANGFGGRPFIPFQPAQGQGQQQQQPPAPPVAGEATGLLPIPLQVDAYGYPVVDAHGYPIPAGGGQAPIVQAQIPPGYIDPRMLDPTRYWLLGQLEWWFSVDNLCRDLFLRSKVRLQSFVILLVPRKCSPSLVIAQMDKEGWVLISIIASFNRIKNLTSDLSIVVECLRMTPLLETSPKGTHVRLRQQWPEWVLPNATANEEVKKEFEEAEKNKEATKSDEVEEGEIVEDKKETEKETEIEEPTKEVESAPAPAPTETETETEAATEEAVEKPSSPSPDADAVSIRSPTLKSQCEFA